MRLGTVAVRTELGIFERLCAKLDDTTAVDLTSARSSWLERTLPARTAAEIARVQVPADLVGLLAHGRAGLEWAREALEHAVASGIEYDARGARLRHDLTEVTLLAPLPRPPAMSCFATWAEHLRDATAKAAPVEFPSEESGILPYYKANVGAIGAPGSLLRAPDYDTTFLDVECELAAVVLGDVADLSEDEAADAIAGYCIFNDVSARTVQLEEMRSGLGPTKGKDFDGSNILGPWLVTSDEISDPQNLRMSFHVNDEELSSYNTSGMHWTFPQMLSYLSKGQSLAAGHIFTSGCFPRGCMYDLERSLQSGDKVTMEIEQVGQLSNVVG